MRTRILESSVNFKADDREINFLQKAIKALPMKKMGLELYNNVMEYTCRMGSMQSVILEPNNDVLHSIWIPENARNIHSTEDYQGFTLRGIDYFIYRRPRHHIKKIYIY